MSGHPFDALDDRKKPPASKRDLDAWVAQAVSKTGIVERRLSWIVASCVVVAALQRAVHHDGKPRFLLKGGAYLELRLGLHARATTDVDALFRGEFDDFLDVLDSCLTPWGPLEVTRSEVEVIEKARRVVKPRRFKIHLRINGAVWRSIDVEVAADEGGAGDRVEVVSSPPLRHFGLPSPVELAGIALDYQVAQKLHACSDPHDPPDAKNDRVRDVVDLLLLRQAFYRDARDRGSLRGACVALFDARYQEAVRLGIAPRPWPPTVLAHEHWESDYERARDEVGIEVDLHAAVAAVNDWVAAIGLPADADIV